jgi:hypothetical protein
MPEPQLLQNHSQRYFASFEIGVLTNKREYSIQSRQLFLCHLQIINESSDDVYVECIYDCDLIFWT